MGPHTRVPMGHYTHTPFQYLIDDHPSRQPQRALGPVVRGSFMVWWDRDGDDPDGRVFTHHTTDSF